MPAAQQPPAKQQRKAPRRHVTTACLACRESKIKCDGAQPSCEKCKAKGKECRYSQDEDKRRVSLRNAIEILSARVDQLSHHVLAHGLQLPPMEPAQAAQLVRILDVLRLPQSAMRRASSADALNPPPDPGTSLDFAPAGFDWNLLDPQTWPVSYAANQSFNPVIEPPPVPRASLSEPVVPPPQHHLASPSQSLPQPATGQNTPQDAADNSDDESEDELIKQISVRMGSLQLAPDGHLRYYGPTSSLALLRDFPDTDHHGVNRSVRSRGQAALEAAGVGQSVDRAIEEHLIGLYFAWQDPFFHVVDEVMYRIGKEEWRVQKQDVAYYSEVLTNAMCAAGAAFDGRYHPNFVTWPKSLGEFFADRAKALLELEMDSPCIATVQALVILGGHEMACKRDARGWLYSGMAMRLAFDLGLHLDMTSYIEKGKMSSSEAELRRTTFWGTYVVDHLSGFYYGRPVRINNGEISVSKPASDLTSCMINPWVAYGSQNALASDPSLSFQVPVEIVTRQSVELCEIMEPLGHVLYGVSDISKKDLQELSFRVTNQMFNWKASLPPLLQVDHHDTTTAYLPHVLLLHMSYHQFMIYIHRPYVSKTYIQPSPPQGPGHVHAQQMCIESSIAVAELLRLYEIRYTFRRMNIQAVSIIFTTSLILIFIICSKRGLSHFSNSNNLTGGTSADGANDAASHLSVCFRALEDLTQSYDSARRTREFLVALQRRWENQSRGWNSAGKRLPKDRDRPQPAVQQDQKRPRASTYAVGTGPLAANPTANRPAATAAGGSGAGTGEFELDWGTFASARGGADAQNASPDSLGDDLLAQLCSIGPAGAPFS
ncbi:uncharacterized protein K452DRAFT_244065 [Aplosporella prunicola CBS 121167]|uniref:Zn(2)-C6 fungal-type domain-containing protein n=1 Tax=Aplosporella prunicola CBS 121167 TaxID=1176127 RepID=A0A6A6BR90_9PEZI|nr:uncharacterized protein K452DRAFT_244065 [Aplosporella prunicola CBS 121167]KAF2145744.1 hypothetical protein K452DRAFT_244065 [Aplosporella prunicola CBS 121167]